MDFLNFYNLREHPFSNVVDNRFYYDSYQHSSALIKLKHSIDNKRGLSVVIGDIGSGKTTLARRLLEHLDEDQYEAALLVIIHSSVSSDWLLKKISLQLGVEEVADSKLDILGQIYNRLVEAYEEGKTAVVLMDEVQMLNNREVMEEFRGLLNMEIPEGKLINLIFFGLNDLEDVLSLDEPLKQRVAMRIKLRAFSEKDTAEYIAHRLIVAGCNELIFTDEAIGIIFKYSTGLPRLINTICDNSMLEGFLHRMRTIDASIVKTVAVDLGLELDEAEADKSLYAPPPEDAGSEAPEPTIIRHRSRIAEVSSEEDERAAPASAVEEPDPFAGLEMVDTVAPAIPIIAAVAKPAADIEPDPLDALTPMMDEAPVGPAATAEPEEPDPLDALNPMPDLDTVPSAPEPLAEGPDPLDALAPVHVEDTDTPVSTEPSAEPSHDPIVPTMDVQETYEPGGQEPDPFDSIVEAAETHEVAGGPEGLPEEEGPRLTLSGADEIEDALSALTSSMIGADDTEPPQGEFQIEDNGDISFDLPTGPGGGGQEWGLDAPGGSIEDEFSNLSEADFSTTDDDEQPFAGLINPDKLDEEPGESDSLDELLDFSSGSDEDAPLESEGPDMAPDAEGPEDKKGSSLLSGMFDDLAEDGDGESEENDDGFDTLELDDDDPLASLGKDKH